MTVCGADNVESRTNVCDVTLMVDRNPETKAADRLAQECITCCKPRYVLGLTSKSSTVLVTNIGFGHIKYRGTPPPGVDGQD